MLPKGTGLDNNCDGTEQRRVAAIINWYGISDVSDLVQGPNRKNYAVMWMGKSARSTHDCKASLAAYLGSSRTAPGPKYSWRRRSRRALRSVDATASGPFRGGCAERISDDQRRRPRAVYESRTGRCLSEDPRFPRLSWVAAVGLTASLPALKLDFLIAIPSDDEGVLRLVDIFDLCPLGRHWMEE